MQVSLTFKTQLKVSSQLVLTSHLLQIPAADMEAFLLDEMGKNPALEFAYPDRAAAYTLGGIEGVARGDYDPLLHVAQGLTAVDRLMFQARLQLPPSQHEVALFLLHSLDDHGYLKKTTPELALELDLSPTVIDTVINVLQQLYPPGIAARNLQECLLLQCGYLEATGMECQIIRQLLEQAWDELSHGCWQAIARRLSISMPALAAARQRMVQHFYPYPFLLLEESQPSHVAIRSADLEIWRNQDDGNNPYSLQLPGAEAFELRVCRSFQSVLQSDGGADHDWVKTAVSQANLFIKAFQQRWHTLRQIGDYLLFYQQDFLDKGVAHLRPLTRSAVAEAIGLHESTVSRAIQDKIVRLPNGRYLPLSHFFDNTLAIKDLMQQLLANASTALSDQRLAEALEAEGIHLARRTIAKYRKQLNISSIYHRKSQSIISQFNQEPTMDYSAPR